MAAGKGGPPRCFPQPDHAAARGGVAQAARLKGGLSPGFCRVLQQEAGVGRTRAGRGVQVLAEPGRWQAWAVWRPAGARFWLCKGCLGRAGAFAGSGRRQAWATHEADRSEVAAAV